MTQLLSIVLTSRYVRQPRVIAEVIGGVLLGPTVSSGLALLAGFLSTTLF
jgi:Kef-type K+ transport system membrane component KefB